MENPSGIPCSWYSEIREIFAFTQRCTLCFRLVSDALGWMLRRHDPRLTLWIFEMNMSQLLFLEETYTCSWSHPRFPVTCPLFYQTISVCLVYLLLGLDTREVLVKVVLQSEKNHHRPSRERGRWTFFLKVENLRSSADAETPERPQIIDRSHHRSWGSDRRLLCLRKLPIRLLGWRSSWSRRPWAVPLLGMTIFHGQNREPIDVRMQSSDPPRQGIAKGGMQDPHGYAVTVASGTGRLAELVGVSLSLSGLPKNDDSDSLICAFLLVAIQFRRDKDATLKPLLEKHSGGTFHTFGSCNGLRLLWNHSFQPHRSCISGQNGFWMNGLTCLFANPLNVDLVSKTTHWLLKQWSFLDFS